MRLLTPLYFQAKLPENTPGDTEGNDASKGLELGEAVTVAADGTVELNDVIELAE